MQKNEWIRYIVLTLFCLFISKEDMKTHCIRNRVILAAIGIGIPLVLVSMDMEVVLSCLAGMGIGFLLSFFVAWFSKGGFGMGDAKLVSVIGLYLGISYMGNTVFWGLLLVIAFGVLQRIRKKAAKQAEYPFAPFLTVGILITLGMRWIA